MTSDKKNKYAKFENIFPFFLEAIEDLIIIVSLDNSFKIEYIHECEFLEQLGYSYDTLLGKSLLNLVDFGVKSSKKELLGIIQQNKNRQDVKVIKKNGKLTWVEFISTIFNDEKNQQKLVVKLRDISKRKELEIKLEELEKRLEKISKIVPEIRFWELFTPKKYDQALKASEALLKTAIECLPFDIFMINKNGFYTMQNSTSKELWGDIIGKRPEDIANDQDILAIWKNNNSRAFSGETVIDEVRFEINGNYHHFYNIVNPVYFDDEIQNIIGVNIDITELKLTEQKLEESEKRYREMIDNLDVGFFRVSLDGVILIHNRRYNEIFGKSSLESLIGEKTFNFWKNQEDRKKFLMDLMKTGYVKNCVVSAKKINSDTIILQYNSHLIKDDKGIPIATEGTIIDITEKYSLQRELEESEKKYRDLAELLPDVIFETDLNLNLTYVNSIAYKIFGYTEEDVRSGLNIIPMIDPKYKEKALKNIKLLHEGKKPTPQDYLLVKKDGTTFYSIIHSKPIFKNEKIVGIRGTITNINNFIKAKQELKESEDKFRTIADQSLMGICIIQDFEIKYLNHQLAEIYGYPIDEIRQWKPKELMKIIHPDSKEMVMNQLIKKQQGSEDIITHYIYKIIKKNGNIRYIENYSKTINYQGRTADLSTQIDITDKMNTEQKLKESEEKYRSLFENMNAGFAYHKVIVNDNNDPIDYKYLEVNPAFEKLTGLKKEDLIGKTVTEAIPGIENDPTNWIGKYGKVGLTGIPLEVEDYSVALDQWYKVSGYSPKKGYFAITFTDITDRKQAEEKLKYSEEKYHQLFETSPNGVLLADIKGNILEINSALQQISGYSEKEFIGKNFMDLKIYEENVLNILLEGFNDLFNENRIEFIEIPIRHKEGQIRWVQITGSVITLKGQIYILIVIHDITTQKKADEALKKNEEKFRDLIETSSVGVMEFDVINKKLIYINPKLLDIIGFEKEELSEELFRNYIINQSDLIKLLRSNEESDLEYRITDRYGKLKWLAGKGIPHYNDHGEKESIRVWLDDITEKKIYEELIYELNINFLNFTTDIQNNIQLLLKTALKLLNGRLILYAHKLKFEEQEQYYIITSNNESYTYDSMEFSEKLFISEFIKEGHDFPQTFIDIDKEKYAEFDPFINEIQAKGCFGKMIRTHDGLNHIVSVFYKNNPIISGQDKLVLFLICDAIEIEQRRWQVQQDLEEQNIMLNKINKLKSELFSRTSHELKTPLISIKGFTELLLTLHKSKFDAETISILKEIEDGSKRLENIIKSLLESTKLDAGQLELNLMREDLTFLIKFCVKELHGLTKLRNQSISLNLHDNLETKFDKERIYEVISNLLLNAIKYTPPDGKISIQTEIIDNSYIVSIKDNGIGFTEEEKSQTFKQFGKIERYGQGWDIAADGTGLGLYITKKIVELHDGKIWLESEGRNKGSTFFFSIPIL